MHEGPQPLLMRGVSKRPQQRDRDRFERLVPGEEALELRLDAVDVERREHAAVCGGPLRDLEHVAGGNERGRLVGRVHAVDPVRSDARGAAVAPHHRQRVPMAGRRQQADASALALDNQIRADRRAVAEAIGARAQLTGTDADLVREQIEAGEHAVHRARAVRRGCLRMEYAPVIVDRYAIGERAADVDAKVIGHSSPRSSADRRPPGPVRRWRCGRNLPPGSCRRRQRPARSGKRSPAPRDRGRSVGVCVRWRRRIARGPPSRHECGRSCARDGPRTAAAVLSADDAPPFVRVPELMRLRLCWTAAIELAHRACHRLGYCLVCVALAFVVASCGSTRQTSGGARQRLGLATPRP